MYWNRRHFPNISYKEFITIQFKIKDIIHRISVKFVKASLPKAKKPFYLKPVHQVELDINSVASKAEVYKIGTSPKTIIEGTMAFFELAFYLAADNFKIKTPLFTLYVGARGEYTGKETSLPPDIYPHPVIKSTPLLRDYLKEKVKIEFDGFEDTNGYIAEAIDEASELVNEVMTKGNVIDLIGLGLKIVKDPDNKIRTGVLFTPKSGKIIEGKIIPVNTPKLLKVIVPSELTSGTEYTVSIVTMCSSRNNGILKRPREIKSDFTLKVS